MQARAMQLPRCSPASVPHRAGRCGIIAAAGAACTHSQAQGEDMKKFWRITGWTALLLALVLGYAGYRTIWGTPFTLNMLANRQALFFLIKNPELFTAVGIADGTIFDHHSDKLSAVGVAKRDQDYADAEQYLAEVQRFDRAKLKPQEQITYDILVDQYASGLAFKRFDWLSSEGLYPIAPMWGAEVTLPSFLESQHVVKNEKTARNYVKRLEATGDKLDGLTAEMQRQAKLGVVLPPALLERSLVLVHDAVEPKPAEHPLVTSFVTKMEKVKDLDAKTRDQFKTAAIAAVTDKVYPAYARMKAALEGLREISANQASGVGRLPDGAEYYALMLKQMTTTDYTPAEIHAKGLAEVERISVEMNTLLQAQGLAKGTVAERMQALAKDPKFQLPNDDAGRKEALARFQKILDEMNAKMPEFFRTVPTTKLVVER
ncbi:MAG: DUF885 domain-containing protein, partial [Deltaproteobacteria bacterium]